MSDIVERLRELIEKATKGPWKVDKRHVVLGPESAVYPDGCSICVEIYSHDGRDAALIAAAVNALPSLLDEIERLRALVPEASEHPSPNAREAALVAAAEIVKLDAEWRACEIQSVEQGLAYTRFALKCNMHAADVARALLRSLSTSSGE